MNEVKDKILSSDDSLVHVADVLVVKNLKIMRTAKTEEDLRIGFEKALEPLLESIGITSQGKYEKSIFQVGRADAVHGQVIIEYEAPRAFKSQKWVEHAFEQLLDYIEGEALDKKELLFLTDPKYVGVGFDGEKIFFVQYVGDKQKPKVKLNRKDFVLIGPYKFNQQSARTFLTYMRALSRRLLTAENLADVFGPKSELAPKIVSAFADALEYWDSNPRVRTYYDEWKRLFGIVYGESFGVQQALEVEKLSQLYKVGKDTDFQELLFSVHTYFVFLMKLIAAELLYIHKTSYKSSFSDDLYHSNKEELLTKLWDIESGGIFAKQGITNFLEGDFFRWYLDAFSPRLEDAVRDVVKMLSEFEPATPSIKPETSKDLLKKLYQYLVPQEVRHKLGEYYTPDWLAELLIDEIGYKGDMDTRFLDPACGSGTFLVLAIQKAKESGLAKNEKPLNTIKKIVRNIWGFDLNPLAVIAARTNYLFALGELIYELQDTEIPVYLTDSVLTPSRADGDLFGEFLKVNTSVGEFRVPIGWVKEQTLLGRAAVLTEKLIQNHYSVEEAINIFKKDGLIFQGNQKIVAEFYSRLLALEEQGKNGIWTRFLKNAFAPLMAGKFDFVVGNPPWIRWGYLSKDYREATLELWKDYGLFSLKGYASRLGGGEKDFSMLFTYAAADYYLNKSGKLGFLITQEVYKSKGAGEGFRRFRLGDGEPLKVIKAHDLVQVQPFEGAANKTAIILLQVGKTTSYPVSYTLWRRKKGVGKIPTNFNYSEAKPCLESKKLFARPMGKPNGTWQTFEKGQEELMKIEGENAYKAHEGAYLIPYGVFWIKVKQILSNGNLLIQNLHDAGKWKIQKVEDVVEPDLVYPTVRGADIDRWNATPGIYVIVSQDPKLRCGYAEEVMKKKWPRTYGYLIKFRQTLLNRAMYKKYHEDSGNPFYSQFNIAEYSFAKYRVIWKHMSNDMFAAVVSYYKTPFGFKPLISTHTTSLIEIEDENEAHYICAILNSNPVRDFIKSYSSAGRGFGTPSVLSYVGIIKYDPQNKLHQNLSRLSKALHHCKAENKIDEFSKLEKEVDMNVRLLFGLDKKM